MAKNFTVTFTDDLTGNEIAEGDHFVRTLEIDGERREWDLSSETSEQLDQALAPFMAVGRVTSKRPARKKSSKSDAADIRAWAQQNGMEVPDRGRIPASIREAYYA